MMDRPPVVHEFEVLPARGEHVAQIARVWHDGWFDGHLGHVPEALVPHRTLPEFTRRAQDRLRETTVAVHRPTGAVAGFVVVRRDEVEQVYVDRRWRGSGVADRLLAHAERAVGVDHEIAWLAVVDGNHRARRFYERAGWVDRGPFDNPAEIAGGTMLVPTRRYEKHVGEAVLQ